MRVSSEDCDLLAPGRIPHTHACLGEQGWPVLRGACLRACNQLRLICRGHIRATRHIKSSALIKQGSRQAHQQHQNFGIRSLHRCMFTVVPFFKGLAGDLLASVFDAAEFGGCTSYVIRMKSNLRTRSLQGQLDLKHCQSVFAFL